MSERSIDASFYGKAMKEGAQALSRLAGNDDLYFVRLDQWADKLNSNIEEGGILTSVPARYWADNMGNGTREIEIHMARPGQAMAINLIFDRFDQPLLQGSIAHTGDDGDTGAAVNGFEEIIKVVWPTVAPVVPVTRAKASSGGQGEPWQEPKQPSTSDTEKIDKPKGEKEAAAKDERTWLQKNWIPLTLVTFIVANRLNGGAQQAQQRAPRGTGRALPAGAPRPGTG
jgi:hypothetical protein